MNIKTAQNHALSLYEDARDAIAVVEAMKAQGNKFGKKWSRLKKELLFQK
jgi:hypothetical protein